MMEVLKATARNPRAGDLKVEGKEKNWIEDYVLTMDNFFKMCLIIQRQKCKIPCVIEGESGVGKTVLIRFLAEHIYGTKLKTINIHAGIHENELVEKVAEIKAIC
jgi:midasin (ATPase involved in ribosome maturation)